MGNFIQRFLACSDIVINPNLISVFPIIPFDIQGKAQHFLLFQFTNHGIPNYVVMGILKDEKNFEREMFLKWLQLLVDLIMFQPERESLACYYEKLKQFKNSRYFKEFLYTQEAYDLIHCKAHFTVGGVIHRTIGISCRVDEDRTILFENEVIEFPEHQFLKGDFFREYEDYDNSYFLNYQEYATISYLNAFRYVQFNEERLMKKSSLSLEELKCKDFNYYMQLLDFYLAHQINLKTESEIKRK